MARKKRICKQKNHTSLRSRDKNLKTNHDPIIGLPSSIEHFRQTVDNSVGSSTERIFQGHDDFVTSSRKSTVNNSDTVQGVVLDTEMNSLTRDQLTDVSCYPGVTDVTYMTSDLMSTSEESLPEGVGAHVTLTADTDCSTNRTRQKSSEASCTRRKRTRSRAITCEEFNTDPKRLVSKMKKNCNVKLCTRKRRSRTTRIISAKDICLTDDVDLPKIFPPASCHRKFHCDVIKSFCAKTATENNYRSIDYDVTKHTEMYQTEDKRKSGADQVVLLTETFESCENRPEFTAECSTKPTRWRGNSGVQQSEKKTSRNGFTRTDHSDHQYSKTRPKTPVSDFIVMASSDHGLTSLDTMGCRTEDISSKSHRNTRHGRHKKCDQKNQEDVFTGQCVHDDTSGSSCTVDSRLDNVIAGGVERTHSTSTCESQADSQCVGSDGRKLLAIVDKLTRQARRRGTTHTEMSEEKLKSKKSKKDDTSVIDSSTGDSATGNENHQDSETGVSGSDCSTNSRSGMSDTAAAMRVRSPVADNDRHDSMVSQSKDKDFVMAADSMRITNLDTDVTRSTMYRLRHRPARHSGRLKSCRSTRTARDDVCDDKQEKTSTETDGGKSPESRGKNILTKHVQAETADGNVLRVDVDRCVKHSTENAGKGVPPTGQNMECQLEVSMIDERHMTEFECSPRDQRDTTADTHSHNVTSDTNPATYRLQDCFIDLGSRVTGSASTITGSQPGVASETASGRLRGGRLKVGHTCSTVGHSETAKTRLIVNNLQSITDTNTAAPEKRRISASHMTTDAHRSCHPIQGETAPKPVDQGDDVSDNVSQRTSQVRDFHSSCCDVNDTKPDSSENVVSGSTPSVSNKNATMGTIARYPAHGQQRKAVKIRYPTGEEKFVLINSSTRVTSGILTSSVERSEAVADHVIAKSGRKEDDALEKRHDRHPRDEAKDKSKRQDSQDSSSRQNQLENSKILQMSAPKSDHVTETPSSQECAVFQPGQKIEKKPVDESNVPVKKLKVRSGQTVAGNNEHNVTLLPLSTSSAGAIRKVKLGQSMEVDSSSVCVQSDVSQHSTVAVAVCNDKPHNYETPATSKPIQADSDSVHFPNVSVSDLPGQYATQKTKRNSVTSLTPSTSATRDVANTRSVCNKTDIGSKPTTSQKIKPKHNNVTSLTAAPSAACDVVMYLRDEWHGDRSSRTVMYIPQQCLERMITTLTPAQQQKQQQKDKAPLERNQNNSDGKQANATSKESKPTVKQSCSVVKNANPTVKCNLLERNNVNSDSSNSAPNHTNADTKPRTASDKADSSEAAGSDASYNGSQPSASPASRDADSVEDSDYVDRLIARSHRAYYVAGSQVVRHNGVTWCRSRVITVYHCQMGSMTSRVAPPYLPAVLVYDSNPSLAIMIVSRVCPGIYLVESTHGQLVPRRGHRQHVYERALLKPYPLTSLELLPDNVSDFCLAVGPMERVWRRASARLAAVDMTQSVMGVLRQITGNRECRCFASRWWQQMGAPGRDGGKGTRPRKKKLLTLKQLDGRLQRLALFNCSCPECDPFKRKRKTRFLVAKKSEKVDQENGSQATRDNNQKNKGLMKSRGVDNCVEMTESELMKNNITDATNSLTAGDAKERLTVDVTKVNLTVNDVTIEGVTAEDDRQAFKININVQSNPSLVCPESVDESDMYVDVMGSPESTRSPGDHCINVTQASRSVVDTSVKSGGVDEPDKPSSTEVCVAGKSDAQISDSDNLYTADAAENPTSVRNSRRLYVKFKFRGERKY